MAKAIAISTFAGARYYLCEVVGATPKRTRVRVLVDEVWLPSDRRAYRDDEILVPNDAVRDVEEDDRRLEASPYTGAIYGYGGSVDAIRPWVVCAKCGHSWNGFGGDACFKCGSYYKKEPADA